MYLQVHERGKIGWTQILYFTRSTLWPSVWPNTKNSSYESRAVDDGAWNVIYLNSRLPHHNATCSP